MKTSPRLTRRHFIGTTATAAAALALPARAQDKKVFHFAQIGCGGKGSSDLGNTVNAGGKLVAMCDVDERQARDTYNKYPDVPKFVDFREMLDKMGDEIDGVNVSTPDHTHAAAALEAIRRGKHVYVQKPLARTFHECQLLLEASRKHAVVTQMGNQGHAGAGLKLWKKMMDEGAFGEVQEIHSWSNRPIWPQGMTEPPEPEAIPDGMHWDEWIGPVALRPFSSAYAPFKWRGWWDFGAGAMGDMACHNMDPAFWICQLGLPGAVRAEASAPAGIAYPESSVIEFAFPANEVCPKGVKLTWYDGGKMPQIPEGAHPDVNLGDNGCMVVGSKMTASGGSHAAPPRPIALGGKEFGAEVKEAEQHWNAAMKELSGTDHHGEWVKAALDGDPKMPGSNFEYSVPMTQAILLGCIALRFPGQELKWDADKSKFSNHEEANDWLSFKPRSDYRLSLG